MKEFLSTRPDLVIQYTTDAILFFLFVSLAGLLILALIKIYINFYFSSLERRKQYWLSRLLAFLKEGEKFEFPSSGTNDLIALAKAFAVLHLETRADYRRICGLISNLEIDRKLQRRYHKTVMIFRKVFFLSTLAELPCSHTQNFYLEILRRQNNPLLLHHALFAYSKTVSDAVDMKNFILFLLKFDRLSHVGRNYCKFLIFMALKRLSGEDLGMFVHWLGESRPETRMVRCVTDSIGRLQHPSMEKFLMHIYHSFHSSGEIVAGVLRSLAKCRLKNCQIIKEVYLREEFPIRIACSKIGMKLCYTPKKTLEYLIVYFFDESYYVRQNIYEACLHHHISKESIISIAEKKMPHRKNDRFFQDMMSTYMFTR